MKHTQLISILLSGLVFSASALNAAQGGTLSGGGARPGQTAALVTPTVQQTTPDCDDKEKDEWATWKKVAVVGGTLALVRLHAKTSLGKEQLAAPIDSSYIPLIGKGNALSKLPIVGGIASGIAEHLAYLDRWNQLEVGSKPTNEVIAQAATGNWIRVHNGVNIDALPNGMPQADFNALPFAKFNTAISKQNVPNGVQRTERVMTYYCPPHGLGYVADIGGKVLQGIGALFVLKEAIHAAYDRYRHIHHPVCGDELPHFNDAIKKLANAKTNDNGTKPKAPAA